MNVHAIIVDLGGDVKRSYESIKDCAATSVISYKRPDDFNQYTGPNNSYNYLAQHASIDQTINELIKEAESDYYVVITSGEEVHNITETLEKYTANKKLALVKPYCKYSKLVVHSKTHLFLFGNGSQSIEEKIDIMSQNNNETHLVLNSIEELYESVKQLTWRSDCNSN